MARFIILSGPACVGKGPLMAAMAKFYPELLAHMQRVVLYSERAPRPHERDGVDYHFRTRKRIDQIGQKKGYLSFESRGELQCVDLAAIDKALGEGQDVLFEGNTYLVNKLREIGLFDRYETLKIFLSPLSQAEIIHLKECVPGVDLKNFVADVMRRKLLHRTSKWKGPLGLPDLQDVERRATRALAEMAQAHHYDAVIANHDGEGHDNWDAFYHPIGDARRTMETFAGLLQGKRLHGRLEHWDKALITGKMLDEL
ncbi:guanylate kinase/L-type calcium channel region [Magnetococcus marinus MC-1]|uniref:Guanylate kinase/L-type calcium channel region n=1 Tax=Magnetococcus marinus (strain ATCC BAA-1437 / JCM 17883 / MC-1) TaxID=156889 RepID=A0L5B9_MAGMM|nr:guanylate kinase/L-type calcium channel region [Magnetococcus marinus]ABK43162.1 guanylate kinase/L-type calcium channel region [Magnetococcus marinus MC-1]